MFVFFLGVMGGDQHQFCSIKLVETKRPPTPMMPPNPSQYILIPLLYLSPHALASSHTFTQLLFHKTTPTTNGHFVLYMYITPPSHQLK